MRPRLFCAADAGWCFPAAFQHSRARGTQDKLWTHIRTLLSIVIICVLIAGCATTTADFRAVWKEKAPPPANLAAPAGFVITPSQAYSVVRQSRALSMKHVWHIYADSRYYYVHDTFLGDSPGRVYAQGVRIDGQTGEIVSR